MLRIFQTITFLVISLGLNAQPDRRFDYSKSSFGSFIVKPLFDQSKPIGKEGRPTWTDQKYVDDLFYGPTDEVLSGKRDSISIGTAWMIYFNLNGEITNCQFIINFKDTILITDDDLYKLYQKFKNIKIDMSKVKIVPDYNTNWTEADYGMIVGSMISKKAREKIIMKIKK